MIIAALPRPSGGLLEYKKELIQLFCFYVKFIIRICFRM